MMRYILFVGGGALAGYILTDSYNSRIGGGSTNSASPYLGAGAGALLGYIICQKLHH